MKCLLKILLGVLLGSASPSCRAYTYIRVGLNSNLLVDDGRVLFVQADFTLTALDLESGRVLRREKSRDYGRTTLQRVPPGVVAIGSGKIALMDPGTFEILWETTSHYELTVLSNSLVSCDGDGLVERRDLTNGSVLWAYHLPGALDVVTEADHVLVHRAGTYDEEQEPLTVLLDLENGEQVFRKTPPSGVHWSEVFLDAEHIYVKQGTFKEKRSAFELQNLLVWDLHGQELRPIPFDPEQRKDLRFEGRAFDLDNRRFHNGRVYPGQSSVPQDRLENQVRSIARTNGVEELVHDLEDGVIVVERRKTRGEFENREVEIELSTPERRWTGVLPYLAAGGSISGIARVDEKVLIGSNRGHVECIDLVRGESSWLYVFPAMRHTGSFSYYGPPPMLSEAAAIFRRENRNQIVSGFQLLDGPASAIRVIRDPEPADPFTDLPLLLGIAWGGALISLAALLTLRFHPLTRRKQLGLSSVVLVLLAFICFMAFGRVSPGSCIALSIALVTGLALGILDAVNCFRRGKWWIGSSILAILVLVSLHILPHLFRI